MGAIKLDPSSTGGSLQDGCNVFIGAVPNFFLTAGLTVAGMAMSLLDGEGIGWTPVDPGIYDQFATPTTLIEAPGLKRCITPSSIIFAMSSSDSDALPDVSAPAPGSKIEVFSLGLPGFRYSVTLDGTEADRAEIYQKLADVLVAAGYAASVEVLTFESKDYSLLKIDAAEELGDKDVFLAYYLPDRLEYFAAVHSQISDVMNSDDTTLDSQDCYFGQKECDGDEDWIFPVAIGFFQQP